jgi:GT2 family glycosyltransferase
MRHKLDYLFDFLALIDPLRYQNFHSSICSFPDVDNLDEFAKSLIQEDYTYTTIDARKRDMAYQAFLLGIIAFNKKSILDSTSNPSITDNYIFLRKYYHPLWSFYILCIRLLAFNNPIIEIHAYYNAIHVRKLILSKIDCTAEFIGYKLIDKSRKVCVIIPTLNRYIYLNDALKDLESQTYKNFEVIIVDQNDIPDVSFYETFSLDIKLIKQSEKALWLARNTAIKLTDAELILLYDDDSRVGFDWIESHIKCLDFFGADISSGVSISVIGAKVPEHYSIFRVGDQLDTGNVMLKKSIFKKVGLFDRQFEKQRMGDGEFGLRCHISGIKNVNNPVAKRLHLKASTGGLRQMGSWDGIRPKNLLSPRPIPSVLYFSRKYVGNKLSVLFLLVTVPMSIVPYKFKGNKFLLLSSYFILLITWPLIAFQVFKSWYLATLKLNQGPRIDSL